MEMKKRKIKQAKNRQGNKKYISGKENVKEMIKLKMGRQLQRK